MFLCHVFVQKVTVNSILDINEGFGVFKGTSLNDIILKMMTKSKNAEISHGVRMFHTILDPMLLLPAELRIKF